MTFLRTIGGQGGAPGKFSSPQGLDIDDETGNIFVADTGNDRVQVSENDEILASLGSANISIQGKCGPSPHRS